MTLDHRTPETAVCACSHLIKQHQEVTRFTERPGRSSRAKLRPKVTAKSRYEHCMVCDCKGPR